MNVEPKAPYIYQFDAIGVDRPYRIAGPGAESLQGQRFTREEAEEILTELTLKSIGFMKGL